MNTKPTPGPFARLLIPVMTKKLAVATGRSYAAIAQWKSGASLPAPDLLPRIAKAIGISREQINAAYADDKTARQEAKGGLVLSRGL